MLCKSYTSRFLLVLYSASVHLAAIIYFSDVYLFLSIPAEASNGVLEKRLLEFLEATVWKFPSNTFMLKSFVSTLLGVPGSFPETCLEQLSHR